MKSAQQSSSGSKILFALLILINLNFALDFPLTKLALDHVKPVSLLFWRWVFSVAFFVPVALLSSGQRRRGKLGLGKMLLLTLLAGVVCQTLSTIVMNVGLTMTLAANLSLLFLTVPVFTSLIAAVFLRERLYWTRLVGLVLALLGTLLMSDIDWGSTQWGGRYLLGNTYILISCAGFALGVILTKKLLEGMTYLTVNAYVFSVALVSILPFAYWEDPAFLTRSASFPSSVWLCLLKIGTVWGMAALGFTWVLSRLEASQTSVSLYLTPVFGVVVSALLLGEQLTAAMVAGGICALLGLSLVLYEGRLRQKGWLAASGGEPPNLIHDSSRKSDPEEAKQESSR